MTIGRFSSRRRRLKSSFLSARVSGAPSYDRLLLRRIGSTMEAGRVTVERMLGSWTDIDEPDDEDEEGADELRTLTPSERTVLRHLHDAMSANREQDPKYRIVRRQLIEQGWLQKGCIVFSRYFDSVWWLAGQLSRDLPEEEIGLYAGAQRSGVMRGGIFKACARDILKDRVRAGTLRLMIGTDAASEGLNLQRLGTLINLDLPWNPSRLEQRKGRIQRIGQLRDEVDIFNLRYKDSVEDRVHHLLSSRLESIAKLFGQLPDILEDVWVQVALGNEAAARQTIAAVPERHPFQLRYHEVRRVDWESCAKVLSSDAKKLLLSVGWRP